MIARQRDGSFCTRPLPTSTLVLIALAIACGDNSDPPVAPTPIAQLAISLTRASATLGRIQSNPSNPALLRPTVTYAGCGTTNVIGTVAYTVAANLIGPDGAVYATVAPRRTEDTKEGGMYSGCGTPYFVDPSYAHPVATRIRFLITYRNAAVPGAASTTIEAEAPVDSGTGPLPEQLVIEQFRPSGPRGSADQFVELFNDSVSATTFSYNLCTRRKGTADLTCVQMDRRTIGPFCHFLIGSANYSGRTSPDLRADLFLTNDGSVILLHYGFSQYIVPDRVSMNDDYQTAEASPLAPFDGSNVDRSYIRRGPDTDDNGRDFEMISPSNPRNSSSCAPRQPA